MSFRNPTFTPHPLFTIAPSPPAPPNWNPRFSWNICIWNHHYNSSRLCHSPLFPMRSLIWNLVKASGQGLLCLPMGISKQVKWSNHLVTGMAWTRPQAPNSKTCGSQTWAWSGITWLPLSSPPHTLEVWSGSWEFAFLRNSHMVLMLLASRKHLEAHCRKCTSRGPHWVPHECVELFSWYYPSQTDRKGMDRLSPSRMPHICKDHSTTRGHFCWDLTPNCQQNLCISGSHCFLCSSPHQGFLTLSLFCLLTSYDIFLLLHLTPQR